MPTADTHQALAHLFSELVLGATDRGNSYILNSSDLGLLQSLDGLSSVEASGSVSGGASVAAHATHLAYGLSLMNRWATDGGNPFADATWDDAWKVSSVDALDWSAIRDKLRTEAERWLTTLATPRDATSSELHGMIASVAHVAYHFGAIRQIARSARGPKEGTFS